MKEQSPSIQRYLPWALFTAVIAAFGWLVIRDAWLCDDAFITFRVVDNFHNGFGLRWNVIDRVQVFTHPLWCFALIGLAGVFPSLPLASLWFSIVVSIVAFVIIVPRPGRQNSTLVLVALLIPASKAVVQYSTSGLEGPLAFLLLALLILACGGLEPHWGRYDCWVPLIAAAVVLTRQDLVLIVTPLCAAWIVRKGIRRAATPVLVGGAAVAAWELFSFFYYGSLVPNTALAKLNTGLPPSVKAAQGLHYLGDFAMRDPAGFIALVTCLVFLLAVRADLQARAAAAGVMLYAFYTVTIGGDFMSGRFFAVPVFLAVTETVRTFDDHWRYPATAVVGGSAAALLMVSAHLVGFDGFSDEVISRNGIADERRFYAPALSLSALHHGREIERIGWVHDAKEWRDKGHSGLITDTVGLAGYFGGPDVHILDVVALGEPLLSRLPAMSDSRVGHFQRRLPAGYEESLLTGRLRIEDPDLNAYCRVLWSVTRGPLWSAARLGDGVRLIAGAYEPRLESYLARAGAWHRAPGLAAVPTDFTIEWLYVPEEDQNRPEPRHP